MALKYKVGDKVRIKSIDWYNKNTDNVNKIVRCGAEVFMPEMSQYCGQIATIAEKFKNDYCLNIDDGHWSWTDEMIEGLVEEENVLNKWTGLKVELELSKSVIGVSNVESLCGERFMSGFVKAIIPPDGYQFVDENGNVINTTKIILEKKKKEYPKTYEECAKTLLDRASVRNDLGYKGDLLVAFQKLLVCRDAYWKIAGEEMGLGKTWEPDWNNYNDYKFIIGVSENEIIKCYNTIAQYTLAFPTEEMRDTFKENFKELIENCKEFL